MSEPEYLGVQSPISGALYPVATAEARRRLGQYMTSSQLAIHLARLLDIDPTENSRLLDPGCGEGALTLAVASIWRDQKVRGGTLTATAVEVDNTLAERFRERWSQVESSAIDLRIEKDDFIAAGMRLFESGRRFTHVLLNPPYARLHADSDTARGLRAGGMPSANLYAAFLGIAISLLEEDGALVALVPRSFCNGARFLDLRKLILASCSLEELQVIDSRSEAFKADGVLQENVILRIVKGKKQGPVRLAFGTDSTFADVRRAVVSFDTVVAPTDQTVVFRLPDPALPADPGDGVTLAELGLRVFTGSVVDFRVRSMLRARRGAEDVPLIHAHHVTAAGLTWPTKRAGKKNALRVGPSTAGHVLPSGHYVAIRRFSAKEQVRRAVAVHVDATSEEFLSGVAFENHLNVVGGVSDPLSAQRALKVVGFLNSSVGDAVIRSLLGSTQLNASDLRLLRFPR